MDERLKSYINDQKKKQKSNILKQIGLVEKQYFTSNDNKNDYPLYDYKEKNWYKEDVIDISDEDYAELLKWLPKNIKTEIKKSGWYTYSIILLILNISFVLILMTASIEEGEWIYFGIGVGGFIMFSLLCGIVQLLSEIKQGIDNLKL